MIPRLTYVNRFKNLNKKKPTNYFLITLFIVLGFIILILFFRYKEKKFRSKEKKKQISHLVNEINNFYMNN